MKNNLIQTTLLLIAVFIFAPQAEAFTPASTVTSSELQEKTFSEKFADYVQQRKKKRNERIMKVVTKAKMAVTKVAEKLDIDLEDETMKWLWYAIIAYAASVVLWLLSFFVGFIGWISALASLLGTVCFVIWLLKYLELD